MSDAVAMRWSVLITARRACSDLERYRRELGAAGCAVTAQAPAERMEEAALLPLVANADAIICGDDRVTARVLDAAPRLKVIAKWGTGIDSIDVETARARGIAVCNTPDAFSQPVADSVLGYILLFTRHADTMTADMRAGRWRPVPLRALADCSLGIVGFGNIGRAVARRAAACGMRIRVCDARPVDPASAAAVGAEVASLDTVLSDSDFVSLNADLRADNRHLIDAARLATMRPSAVLINTARGPLVDEAALADALGQGRLAGAALDVFEVEPLPDDSPLRSLPGVYLAPHNANSSLAAAERVHVNTIHSVIRALSMHSS